MAQLFRTTFNVGGTGQPPEIQVGDRQGLYVTRRVGGTTKTIYLKSASDELRDLNPDVYEEDGDVREDLRDYLYQRKYSATCKRYGGGGGGGGVPASLSPSPSPSRRTSLSKSPAVDRAVMERAVAAETAAIRCETKVGDLERVSGGLRARIADLEARERMLASQVDLQLDLLAQGATASYKAVNSLQRERDELVRRLALVEGAEERAGRSSPLAASSSPLSSLSAHNSPAKQKIVDDMRRIDSRINALEDAADASTEIVRSASIGDGSQRSSPMGGERSSPMGGGDGTPGRIYASPTRRLSVGGKGSPDRTVSAARR